MTRGMLNPETYYYRRVFTDAVRAVEAAQSHPAVDAERIAVYRRQPGRGHHPGGGGLSADSQSCHAGCAVPVPLPRATHSLIHFPMTKSSITSKFIATRLRHFQHAGLSSTG